jgi:hypothetical protein
VLSSLRFPLAFLGRWPRRLAAAACLVLAAGSALSGSKSAAARCDPTGSSWSAPPGSVAVPVPVTAGSTGVLRPGSRIGLVPAGSDSGSSGVVADHLPVLRSPTTREDGTAVLLVAVPRAAVPRLARHLDQPLLTLIDAP